jgi:hypothetical protein
VMCCGRGLRVSAGEEGGGIKMEAIGRGEGFKESNRWVPCS